LFRSGLSSPFLGVLTRLRRSRTTFGKFFQIEAFASLDSEVIDTRKFLFGSVLIISSHCPSFPKKAVSGKLSGKASISLFGAHKLCISQWKVFVFTFKIGFVLKSSSSLSDSCSVLSLNFSYFCFFRGLLLFFLFVNFSSLSELMKSSERTSISRYSFVLVSIPREKLLYCFKVW
jgi:hypothetical protein